MWPLLLTGQQTPRSCWLLAVPAVGSVKLCKMPYYLRKKTPTIYSLYSTRLEVIILGRKAPAVPSSSPASGHHCFHTVSPVRAILTPPLLKCYQTQGNAKGQLAFQVPSTPCSPASRAIPAQCPTLPAPPAALLQCPPRAGSVALSLGSSFQPSWLPNIPFPAFLAF